eukprot:TRINITY_DN23692_c0_g1_i1.p1 TRINITY_DN23692_c0_g1~~TRINITY_DN23692_c0_g1_i1.p1  ORF type:complete len:110 (-),score=3.59 TRINITY_DN23692_c0_g1_i1:3-332(-)
MSMLFPSFFFFPPCVNLCVIHIVLFSFLFSFLFSLFLSPLFFLSLFPPFSLLFSLSFFLLLPVLSFLFQGLTTQGCRAQGDIRGTGPSSGDPGFKISSSSSWVELGRFT